MKINKKFSVLVWIPACAGMTEKSAGMTVKRAGVTEIERVKKSK